MLPCSWLLGYSRSTGTGLGPQWAAARARGPANRKTKSVMQTTTQKKFWANKVNSLTAYCTSQTVAWQLIRSESYEQQLEVPTFDQVYEIPKIK